MSDQILVLNSGSSSIKFALFTATDNPLRVLQGTISGLGATPTFSACDATAKPLIAELPAGSTARPLTHESALGWLFNWLDTHGHSQRMLGAGHRVVHGGERYAEPVRIDAGVLAGLEQLVPMAPLHQPHNLAAIRALMELQPQLPQAACFDTAFHRIQPALAQHFALPREITASGVRRYGFHGLSYEHIASVMPAHLGTRADGRIIAAHLGNGASMCALLQRRSIASTMGFTALDGLMMGTRCGAIDPGVLFYLMREKAMTADEVEDLLYRRSGLLGVSGLSSDMRELEASSDPRAREAIELFVYRAAREVGSLAAALGGLDALVFTGGIGERSTRVRAMICEQSRWLGIELDPDANRAHSTLISSQASRVAVCVIPTDEEVVIARHAYRLLA
ncbi:MAG: acetate/propionate family kinase [Burkholderiales bacterium]|nr:acetate/propionate family kinase [Burkholderiales bacterium]